MYVGLLIFSGLFVDVDDVVDGAIESINSSVFDFLLFVHFQVIWME